MLTCQSALLLSSISRLKQLLRATIHVRSESNQRASHESLNAEIGPLVCEASIQNSLLDQLRRDRREQYPVSEMSGGEREIIDAAWADDRQVVRGVRPEPG